MEEPQGKIRLLNANDLTQSFIGWRSASAGYGGLVNRKKGFAMLRVVVQKIVKGELTDGFTLAALAVAGVHF